MAGINGGELIVLLVLAFLLIGPERLPDLAQQLGRLTRELKKMATGAKERVKEELGPDIDDLSVFDPRQYDPRRIVREALMDDEPESPAPPRARRRTPPTGPAGPAAGNGAVAGTAAGVAAAGAGGAAAAASTATADRPMSPTAIVAAAGGGSTATARPGGATATDVVEQGETYVVPFDDEAT